MVRQSPAVYRRRRIVVFGGLILVIALIVAGIWVLIAQPWAADANDNEPPAVIEAPDASPSPSPSPTESAALESDAETPAPEASESPAPEAAPPCRARDIEVQAITDTTDYDADRLPQFSIRLTNMGEECTMNVGTSTQRFTVSSGSDVWWRSTDCQQEPSDMVVTLAAGETVTSAEPVVWDRTRSSVDTCDSERPRAWGGGAGYHLSVEIGGFASRQTAFFMLY